MVVLSQAGAGPVAPVAPSPDQVFREYAPRIERLAGTLLGNPADAEDVTQEVLLRVLQGAPSFRGEAGFWTWLYRVTVNAALAFRRRREAREKHLTATTTALSEADPTLAPAQGEGPVQQALGREAQERIAGAIAALPAHSRDVFVLADVEEIPSAEVAGLLGLSLPAVKSRLRRARLRMRRTLAPYFEEDAAEVPKRKTSGHSKRGNLRGARGRLTSGEESRQARTPEPL